MVVVVVALTFSALSGGSDVMAMLIMFERLASKTMITLAFSFSFFCVGPIQEVK